MTSTRGMLHVLQKHCKDLGRMSEDSDFDSELREQVKTKVSTCLCSTKLCEDELKNNTTGGSDGLVGELLKYGGVGMVNMVHQLFEVVWHEETVPKQWREGLIVNLFKKEDKKDPGNYRGITLLRVVLVEDQRVRRNSYVPLEVIKEYW